MRYSAAANAPLDGAGSPCQLKTRQGNQERVGARNQKSKPGGLAVTGQTMALAVVHLNWIAAGPAVPAAVTGRADNTAVAGGYQPKGALGSARMWPSKKAMVATEAATAIAIEMQRPEARWDGFPRRTVSRAGWAFHRGNDSCRLFRWRRLCDRCSPL